MNLIIAIPLWPATAVLLGVMAPAVMEARTEPWRTAAQFGFGLGVAALLAVSAWLWFVPFS